MKNIEIVAVAEAATVAASDAAFPSRIEIVTDRRPAYSPAFRARMIEASLVPGIRVPDLALQHGIHVSLIYRWRRMAKLEDKTQSPRPSKLAQRAAAGKTMAVNPPVAFIPIGVLGRPEGETPSAADIAAPPSNVSRHEAYDQPGMIDIHMADGTRLRVDAAVDEQAFRRVWSVLRATS
ncbi:transposase [Acidisphaera sp. L21]|uniref:transposase n=1 Tax=Acidisphaera sp. L21 TaxID=1641851 RepID=UPI00131C729D|nr:transposase [Acidisphaera sp. L21]